MTGQTELMGDGVRGSCYLRYIIIETIFDIKQLLKSSLIISRSLYHLMS